MAQFVEPPIFNVPRGPSFGNVIRDAGSAVQGIMAAIDADEEQRRKRKSEDIAAAMAGEDTLLKLSPMLSEFEEAKPLPMTQPADPELGIPEQKALDLPLGEKRLSKPLLSEITLPDGRKVPIPPVRGSLERTRAEQQAQANVGTEVLTQEAWDSLPEFYQRRWKPGQRVDSATIGAIGMEVLKAANAKAGKTPSFKDKWDRQLEMDVQVSDEVIALDPNRYGPPREARISAEAGRDEARAAAASARAEAVAARAEAAAEKKADKEAATQTELNDAADRIIQGEPAATVKASVRDAAVRKARESGARVYTTQAQKDKVVTLESIKEDVNRLTELLADPKVAEYFGPLAGRMSGVMAGLPEIPTALGGAVTKIPPEVHEARSLMLNLQDRTLRQRSGAQINPQELKRIVQFSPDPKHQFSKTLINLRKMGGEIDSLITGQFGDAGTGTVAPAGIKPGSKIGRFTVLSVE